MIDQIMIIETASPACLGEVLTILSRAELPPDGVEEYLDGFLVARNGGGQIIGCIGLERHGKLGLLRSAAVLPEFRGQRIGNKLVRELLNRAANDGFTEVALLTTTAKDYFAGKFGFKETKRTRFQKRLANSPEWNLPRCSSAVLMTLKLKPGADIFS
jgi:N-acetylglutamate synthase-like GNAT family acetyltransferase